MYYLDYFSSYFCVVGLVWFLLLLSIKYLPSFFKQERRTVERWQERLFLYSIPISLVLGYTLFHFTNLYEYMRLV